MWNDNCAVGVVIVSSNYPADYETGFLIEGELPDEDSRVVFHAGTAIDESGKLITSGGRVLVATASSPFSVEEARSSAYRLASSVSFNESRYRSDIALDAV